MKGRAIYRWKSFWLGVLVMGFLSWAWWDSLHWKTWLSYGESTLCHAGSGICLANREEVLESHLEREAVDPKEAVWSEARLDAPDVLHVSADERQYSSYYAREEWMGGTRPVARNAAAAHFYMALLFPVAGAWAVYLPHWLVMVCFLAVWSGFLVWRWRRERRMSL